MKIIPILNSENADLFCEHTPNQVIQRGFDLLTTNYLKPGVSLSLLGISQNEALLNTGLIDSTDSIDPHVHLSAVVLRLTHGDEVQLYVHEADHDPLNCFAYKPEGNYRTVSLQYSSSVRFSSDDNLPVNTVAFSILGDLNLETGELNTIAGGGSTVTDDKVEVVGYSLTARRVNANRMQKQTEPA